MLCKVNLKFLGSRPSFVSKSNVQYYEYSFLDSKSFDILRLNSTDIVEFAKDKEQDFVLNYNFDYNKFNFADF